MILFSRHAKNRMRKFKLSQIDVENVVLKPDAIEDELKGRKNAWKRYGDRFIKVTYITEEKRTAA